MTTPATPATPAPNSASPATPAKESIGTKCKNFFEHIWSWFENDAAKFETAAATAISASAPMLNELIALTAGAPEAAKVTSIANQAITDLNNTAALLKGAGATDATKHTVAGLLGNVATALPTLLTDADVKNSAHAAKIEATVNTVVGVVQAILAALPANRAVSMVGAAQTA